MKTVKIFFCLGVIFLSFNGCFSNNQDRKTAKSDDGDITGDEKVTSDNDDSSQYNDEDNDATNDSDDSSEDDDSIDDHNTYDDDAIPDDDDNVTGDDDNIAGDDDTIEDDDMHGNNDDIIDNDDDETADDDNSVDDDDYGYRIECDPEAHMCNNQLGLVLGLKECHPEDKICVECYEDTHCPNGIKCNQEVYKCEDGDLSEPTVECDDPYEFLCTDPYAYRGGLRHCHPKKKICVECFDNMHCQKGFYCDEKKNICIKGVKEIPFFPCKEDNDCEENPEADKARLFYCDAEKGRCVECNGYCGGKGECDKETHQCYDPYITPPPCDPPCPKGDGWYCWEDGKTAWCRQRGGYCEWCDILTECRHEDSVCWRPAGVPQEAGGYCFKKCASDADCKQFDQPDKPSICYEGVCLCGWM